MAALPRRRFLEVSTEDVSLSQLRLVSFRANPWRALASCLRWLGLLLDYLLHSFGDILSGRDSPERRALHLRQAFEHAGGSFVKFGIHLSMRLDLMPWAYCRELSCMTDRMQPFAVQQAIATIERSAGRTLPAIFSQFDPDPILSTSVACSYQAVLRDGRKVVAKVRRPGIGERFMSDLQAFEWLLAVAEFLTFFRPGLTDGMRMEFRDLLLEELDFIQEARRQDAFRRAAEDTGKKFFSAPRVHLDLTTEDVLVNEFASGIWLWELLSAVEHGDPKVLERAAQMNIDPKRVAARLLWVNNWSWSEHLFFHADPNPDNIIVGQDGKLFLINFTSTGALSREKRRAMRQNLHYARQRDPQNMARASLILLEPLPPLDLIELVQELETHNWQLIFALEASPRGVSWPERTSAVQWAGIVQLARRHGIAIDIQVLRLIRATLLLESTAARLDRRIDFVQAFSKFHAYRAERARQRITHSVLDQMEGRGLEQTIIQLDRTAQAAQDMAFQLSHQLALPAVNFSSLMGKWSFAIYTLFSFLAQAAVLTLLGVLAAALPAYLATGRVPGLAGLLGGVLTNPVYLVVLLVLIFANGRAVVFRMEDKEI